MKITINRVEYDVVDKHWSYEQIANIAWRDRGRIDPIPEGFVYTIVYCNAFRKDAGILSPGGSSVRVKNGTKFDCCITGNA